MRVRAGLEQSSRNARSLDNINNNKIFGINNCEIDPKIDVKEAL